MTKTHEREFGVGRYEPDFAPSDFTLFPDPKKFLGGKTHGFDSEATAVTQESVYTERNVYKEIYEKLFIPSSDLFKANNKNPQDNDRLHYLICNVNENNLHNSGSEWHICTQRTSCLRNCFVRNKNENALCKCHR